MDLKAGRMDMNWTRLIQSPAFSGSMGSKQLSRNGLDRVEVRP